MQISWKFIEDNVFHGSCNSINAFMNVRDTSLKVSRKSTFQQKNTRKLMDVYGAFLEVPWNFNRTSMEIP